MTTCLLMGTKYSSCMRMWCTSGFRNQILYNSIYIQQLREQSNLLGTNYIENMYIQITRYVDTFRVILRTMIVFDIDIIIFTRIRCAQISIEFGVKYINTFVNNLYCKYCTQVYYILFCTDEYIVSYRFLHCSILTIILNVVVWIYYRQFAGSKYQIHIRFLATLTVCVCVCKFGCCLQNIKQIYNSFQTPPQLTDFTVYLSLYSIASSRQIHLIGSFTFNE